MVNVKVILLKNFNLSILNKFYKRSVFKMNYNDNIKRLLDDIISDIASQKEAYIKNPGVDFTRDRKLTFEQVIKIVLSLKGNTLNKELYDFFGRCPDDIATSSAFVQQRDKLKEDVFEEIFHRFNDSMEDFKNYKGYKLYAVDGSDINIAYDKHADTYVQASTKTKKDGTEGRGFNQYHLNAIYDILNKVYVDATIVPRSKADERQAFVDMLENINLQHKTLFIADRGYPSWNLFTHFKYKNNADYLIRVQNQKLTFINDLPMIELDIDRTITISTNQYDRGKDNYIIVQTRKGKQKNRIYKKGKSRSVVKWDFSDLEQLNIRIVRFPITANTYETIFTSLPRDKFPIEEIKHLYGLRWGIETSFRELKYIVGLVNLHSKKDAFIRQEIFARLTMYNFCERILSAAVVKQDAGRKYKYQVNYTMGMQICLDFYRALVESDALYELTSKYILPIRPGRSDKRKLKPKSFVCFTYRVAA